MIFIKLLILLPLNFIRMEIVVFILISSKNGKLYFGQSTDLRKTIYAHNKGLSAFTKKDAPWELLAQKKVETRSEAKAMELELRKMRSKEEVLKYMLYQEFEIES